MIPLVELASGGGGAKRMWQTSSGSFSQKSSVKKRNRERNVEANVSLVQSWISETQILVNLSSERIASLCIEKHMKRTKTQTKKRNMLIRWLHSQTGTFLLAETQPQLVLVLVFSCAS